MFCFELIELNHGTINHTSSFLSENLIFFQGILRDESNDIKEI